MISFKKTLLFPHSLRQLVVMAFLLVLLPLLVLAYQAYENLISLSAQAAAINHTTLLDARRSEAMTSIALGMERSYRQYCVLDNSTLAELYQNKHQQYTHMLHAHAPVLQEVHDYQTLRYLLSKLSEINCKEGKPASASSDFLKKFSLSNVSMAQKTRDIIFSRGQQLQQNIAQRGHFFGWQALWLLLVSVLLAVLFTTMITGPVKKIEYMINQLGEGHTLLNSVFFKGPRELGSLAQRIVWLSERLSWLESQRHEFLRCISHELKTPLASMREGTELLADEIAGKLTAEQKEVVTILNNSSLHLQQLIERLLDYNRQLADKPAHYKQVEFRKIIEDVISAHSLPARAKMMHTELHLQCENCLAEPTLLMQVLGNIYSNAVHYGRESSTIWIHSRQINGKIQIDIANTGTPIPTAEQRMIFEPFFQGSQQRKGAVKGTGLGLSIARDCALRMQGNLQLVPVDYADTCFRIELPCT